MERGRSLKRWAYLGYVWGMHGTSKWGCPETNLHWKYKFGSITTYVIIGAVSVYNKIASEDNIDQEEGKA